MSKPEEQLHVYLMAEHKELCLLTTMLKEEQTLILNRRTEELMDLLIRIEVQLSRIRDIQQNRSETLRDLLKNTTLAIPPTLLARIQLLPVPLVNENLKLVFDIDTEVKVVHELTYQNHVLLSRSVYFLEEVLAPMLESQRDTTTYGKDGVVQKGKLQNTYQAVA